jgi:predicted PurR-regulated permease PerM
MSRVWKGWILAVLGIALLLFLYYLRAVFLPLLVAAAMAYILNPAVTSLEARRVPRLASIAGLYVVGLGLFAVVVFWAVPAVVDQSVDFMHETFTAKDAKIHRLLAWGDRRMTDWLGEENWTQVLERIREGLKGKTDQLAVMGGRVAGDLVGLLVSGVGGLFGVVSFVALVPVYLFFLLKNMNAWWERFTHLIPRQYRERTLATMFRIHRANAAFFRGQITISLVDGGILWVGLMLLGVKFSLLFGLLYMVASVIPYLGPTLMFVVVELFVLADAGRIDMSFWLVAGLFLLIQALEGAVLQPLIMGRETGLHPIQIILSLLVCGELFGFFGLLIGVPIASVSRILVEDYVWPLFEDVAQITKVRHRPDAPPPAQS